MITHDPQAPIRGKAAGVPYVALSPVDGAEAAILCPLVAAERSEAAVGGMRAGSGHPQDVPIVKAWGLCVTGDRVIVQYAEDGSLFRLPGGTVEVGESAAAAVERELAEEYLLSVRVGEFVTTWENIFELRGDRYHEIVLVHRMECEVPPGGLTHREHKGIRLDWWPLASLVGKPTAPRSLASLALSPPPHLR